jgi:predicted esterase
MRNPNEHDLLYEEVRIKTEDYISLYGWFIYSSIETVTNLSTIIYFQENAGSKYLIIYLIYSRPDILISLDIGMRLPLISALVKNLNINILIMGYRGYGPSEGSPSEHGIKLDSEAIMNYVFKQINTKINTNKIFIMGRSLGGAVAAHIQAKNNYPIKGLILENTFLSIGDLVDKIFPFVRKFKWLLLRNHWETKKIINTIKCPIYFVMADKDELVPIEHMNELVRLGSTSSLFVKKYVIRGAGHNDGFYLDKDGYLESFRKFIEEVYEQDVKRSDYLGGKKFN